MATPNSFSPCPFCGGSEGDCCERMARSLESRAPRNAVIGDRVFIEQAWEDGAGHFHDAYAEVIGIADDGELRLRFEDKAVDDFYGNGAAGAGYGTDTEVEVVEKGATE